MLDERDLQAIAKLIRDSEDRTAATIDAKLEPITARLDKLESKVDQIQGDVDWLKEETEITRGALNHLIDWSDKVSDAVGFPLPKT